MNGSLPESERSLAEQHISTCEGCRLELELVRAIGSQEKAPAVGKDDWTLDRIFGAEKNPGGGSNAAPMEPASASASSSSDDAADSLFGPAAPASSTPSPAAEHDAAETAAEPPRKWGKRTGAPAEGASWDFEPADAKSSVKPPEQSLFFATEALARRKDLDSKKGSNLRVILWGTGGLAGAALLAFSFYLVLHMNAPAPDISTPGSQAPATDGTGTTTPETPPAPDPVTLQSPPNSAPPQETAPPPDNSAQVAPAAPPRVSASSTAPPPLPLGPVTRTPTATTTEPKPVAAVPRSSAPVERHTVSGPRIAPATETPHPAQTRPAPEPVTPSDDDSSPEPVIGSNGHAWSDGSEDVVPAPKPTRPATRGSSMWQSRAPKPEEPPPAAATPDPNSPIEKLHLATVAAEEHGDLDALRRLRTTWKMFTVKIVGPDRSRAKREYADCLWAIQDLTGRHADQKDALAAYREYLLGAPAGGADSRSVSRLRQLEDAISERR